MTSIRRNASTRVGLRNGRLVCSLRIITVTGRVNSHAGISTRVERNGLTADQGPRADLNAGLVVRVLIPEVVLPTDQAIMRAVGQDARARPQIRPMRQISVRTRRNVLTVRRVTQRPVVNGALLPYAVRCRVHMGAATVQRLLPLRLQRGR